MIILATFILLLDLIAMCGRAWLMKNIGLISVEEVIFHLKVPLTGTSSEMIWSIISEIILIPLAIALIVGTLLWRLHGNLHLTAWQRPFTFSLRKLAPRLLAIFGVIMLVGQLVAFNNDYKITDYIASQIENSPFIEENFVDPAETKLTFPEKKRNLIYIYAESLEATYLSRENGGLQDNSLMPELEELALKNTNFSNSAYLGGARQTTATDYTMAGLVAQTAGLPIKLPVDMNYLGDSASSLLHGATTLGEILEKEGYKNVFMAGSDMTFGGRRTYFVQHGNYEIKDIYTAEEDGIIPKDRRVFWGFEDSYLFTYAKQELEKLAKTDQPFNFTMLTENTHFPDGYLEDSCPTPYDDQYSNVIACSSAQLSSFLAWLKTQDFYENTTVIINGDHLTMASNDILGDGSDIMKSDAMGSKKKYDRTTFNLFLNSAVKKPANSVVKNRIFTTLDLFPTTLAALGVKIDGDRLALGTNLYSGELTLAEKAGFDNLTSELAKRSDFYTFKFL